MKFNTSLIFVLQLKDNQYPKLLQNCNEQFVSNLSLLVCCAYYVFDRNGFFLDEIQQLYQEIVSLAIGVQGHSRGSAGLGSMNIASGSSYGLIGGRKAVKRHV